jgi:CRP-like cAMP-binding protein
MAEASDREFDYLRNRALKAKSRSPIERVANFFLAIAGINASEGRDPLIVTGNVSSGDVAERLDMSIDTLADALLSLRQGGLIDVSDHVLRIRNIAGLESMTANGPAQSCQREAVRQFSR